MYDRTLWVNGKLSKSTISVYFYSRFYDLVVIDESHNHRGHAGARPEGESHFRVRVVASAFQGKSRVECHRMINQVLAEELKQQIHALAIEAKPPE